MNAYATKKQKVVALMSNTRMPGPSTITVRPATAADSDALNSLVRRCPMQADISLIVERDPDFFALSRARGRTTTFLAEVDGAVIGCISTWRHSAWLGGTPSDICYIGDLRIAPEQRRRGIATQLVSRLDKFLDTLPQVPFLLATGAGNSAVERLMSRFGTADEPLARFVSWQSPGHRTQNLCRPRFGRGRASRRGRTHRVPR